MLSYFHWFKGVLAAMSMAALFNHLKKKITIFFIIATVVFCILLYYFLFFTDHSASKGLVAFLLSALIATGIAILWLFNKYMKLPLQKGSKERNLL
jgi:hypothetical protein